MMTREEGLAKYNALCKRHDDIKHALLSLDLGEEAKDILRKEFKRVCRALSSSEGRWKWMLCMPIDGSPQYYE